MPMPSEPEMRAAIAARDQTSDHRFFYAVITTGVFCRPSCASRPARPENLRFFPDADAALAAGFRPCKRCRPTDPEPTLTRLADTARFIEAHAEERLTLKGLAERVGLSPSHLQRVFKAAFGVSPRAYRDAVRMKRLKAALKEGDDVTGAIFSAGFGSLSRVYGERARNIGMTPTAYRAGGAGRDDRLRVAGHVARRPAAGRHRTRCLLRAVRGGRGGPARAAPAGVSERGPRHFRCAGGPGTGRLGHGAGRAPRRRRAAPRSAARSTRDRLPDAGLALPPEPCGSATRSATASWPGASSDRVRLGPLLRPARRTASRCWCPATASCGGTATWPPIAGASSGNARSSTRSDRAPWGREGAPRERRPSGRHARCPTPRTS